MTSPDSELETQMTLAKAALSMGYWEALLAGLGLETIPQLVAYLKSLEPK